MEANRKDFPTKSYSEWEEYCQNNFYVEGNGPITRATDRALHPAWQHLDPAYYIVLPGSLKEINARKEELGKILFPQEDIDENCLEGGKKKTSKNNELSHAGDECFAPTEINGSCILTFRVTKPVMAFYSGMSRDQQTIKSKKDGLLGAKAHRWFLRSVGGTKDEQMTLLGTNEFFLSRATPPTEIQRKRIVKMAMLYEMDQKNQEKLFSLLGYNIHYNNQYPNFLFNAKNDLNLTVKQYMQLDEIYQQGTCTESETLEQQSESDTTTTYINKQYDKMIQKCVELKEHSNNEDIDTKLVEIMKPYIVSLKQCITESYGRLRRKLHVHIAEYMLDFKSDTHFWDKQLCGLDLKCFKESGFQTKSKEEQFRIGFYMRLRRLYVLGDLSTVTKFDDGIEKELLVDTIMHHFHDVNTRGEPRPPRKNKNGLNNGETVSLPFFDWEYISWLESKRHGENISPEERKIKPTNFTDFTREDFIRVLLVCGLITTEIDFKKEFGEYLYEPLNKNFVLDKAILDAMDHSTNGEKNYKAVVESLQQFKKWK